MSDLTKKRSLFSLIVLRLTTLGLLVAVFAAIMFFAGRGIKNTNPVSPARTVRIEKANGLYRFIKDGKPFLLKGGAGYTNLRELAECGGNTAFCWDTSKVEQTLREAARYNLFVIIGFPVPEGKDVFYDSPANVEALYKSCNEFVNRFKDNPQVLAWCLGNELHMPLTVTTPPFYKAYNRLLDMIHRTDPNHPVSTAVMNIPKRVMINMQWRIPALDFICINTYNRLKVIESDLSLIRKFWEGPYLIGEWGPNGGWEAEFTKWEAPIENTSTKKAEQFYELYKNYMPVKDPRFLGSLAFYWGKRQEYTHTWYSIFNEADEPGEVFEVLSDCWKDTLTKHVSPRVDYMLVDSLGAEDNIIMSVGTIHKAAIILASAQAADSLKYHWEILKDDWQTWGSTWVNFKKPALEKDVLLTDSLREITFKAPKTEGPYRIFVTVSNAKGYCATANTPIYITQ